jgi:isopenicillin N synthase-like dioxygenase
MTTEMMSSLSEGTADVPVVDLAPFFAVDATPEQRAAVAAEMADACERVGFVLVAGHGVPQETIDAFYDVSKRFFQLPLEQKLESKSPIGKLFQGYACPGDGPGYHTSERQSFNVFRYDTIAEAVDHGYPDDIGAVFYEAMWPREPAEFRELWREYFEAMEALARRILRVFELGLGLPDGWFEDKIAHDPSTQAGNYYSNEIESGHEPSPFRFKAHVDGSIITVLYQDDGPGSLQLHQRGKGWRDVASVPGTFVVNIGELMERWTNDRFVATPHRVLKPLSDAEQTPRISAPFFLKADFDAVIAPIPELLAPGEQPKYEPVTGKGWLTKGQDDIYKGYDSTVQFANRAELHDITT